MNSSDRTISRVAEGNLYEREGQPQPSSDHCVQNLQFDGIAETRIFKDTITAQASSAEDVIWHQGDVLFRGRCYIPIEPSGP